MSTNTAAQKQNKREEKQRLEKEAETTVRSWGYKHVFTWTDGPNTHYPPHSHRGATTHLILEGELLVRHLDDDDESNNSKNGSHNSKGGDDNREDERGGKERGTKQGRVKNQDIRGENNPQRLGVGHRWDVPAGRVHEVWVGAQGCRYVIGE